MDDNDSVIAVTEENQDELSVIDGSSLVSRKRCRKPNKKLFFSGSVKKKKNSQSRENLCMERGGNPQGNSGIPKKPL